MRGAPERQLQMLATVNLGLRPSDHPIRRIRSVVEAVLAELDGEFSAMCARGRPSVPPEQLLKATVLMALYSIRSERAFCERLNSDLLFKWFLDLPIGPRAFDATTLSKNRTRLSTGHHTGRRGRSAQAPGRSGPVQFGSQSPPFSAQTAFPLNEGRPFSAVLRDERGRCASSHRCPWG